MYGYVAINKSEMKFKEFDMYQTFYCGLCHKLKEKYGFWGQLSLNYDMTFLIILLTSLYEPETLTQKRKCILHPFEHKEISSNLFTEYIADMNILLVRYKCTDDWQDEKKILKLIYGNLLRGKSKKQRELYRDKIRRMDLLLFDLAEGERQNNQDVDYMAGLFGKVMAEVVVFKQDEWTDNLYTLGFYLGKFIYLLDAYEDIEKDIKKGTYNPLQKRYETPEFEEECQVVLTMMVSECCKEFEKLPIIDYAEILRNILYSGVWCRYLAVREKRQKAVLKEQENS
jgi:hypothetical protein